MPLMVKAVMAADQALARACRLTAAAPEPSWNGQIPRLHLIFVTRMRH